MAEKAQRWPAAKRRVTDDAAGYKILLDLFAEYGDTEENPIPVAIETSRGLLVVRMANSNHRNHTAQTRADPRRPAPCTPTCAGATPTPATPRVLATAAKDPANSNRSQN
ncbi:hypothetical protein [Streptomyces sp. NPDC058964]|uniref:hypothetical protein n=1 Tax=Streptomyces sp. NPDC058964 TaxID=3346681 RepID=UPI0036753001